MMELDEAIEIVKEIVNEQKESKKNWYNQGFTYMAKLKNRNVKALETVLKEVEKNGTD